MSFLNPVNEPVLRFSSTDAGAPQINYAARTAGDVKAILKKCLVTGYGTKASAGWSIVNEVDHVAGFVAPSAAMSDYIFMIDDTSTASTRWNYSYLGVIANFSGGVISKDNTIIYPNRPSNKWDVIVTQIGFYFIETVASAYDFTVVGSSVLYFGDVRRLIDNGAKNIAFWCVGFNSDSINNGSPSGFFAASNTSESKHIVVNGGFISYDEHLQIVLLKNDTKTPAKTDIEVWDKWYYRNVSGEILSQQVGVLLHARANTNSSPSATEYPNILGGRPVAVFAPIRGVGAKDSVLSSSRALIAIYTDYWEF